MGDSVWTRRPVSSLDLGWTVLVCFGDGSGGDRGDCGGFERKGLVRKWRVEDGKIDSSLSLSPFLSLAYLDVDALDHHLPRLEQHLGHHADLALVGPGDHLHRVPGLDVHGLEDGLAVGRQRRRLPLLAWALWRWWWGGSFLGVTVFFDSKVFDGVS